MPRLEDDYPDFPVILGFGTTHEMRDPEQRSRLWALKSTSKAACIAADKQAYPARAVGFLARKP